MQEVLIGRQPIFTRDMDLWAYELLFRSSSENQSGPLDGNQATSQVIVNAFTEFGIDRVVGNNLAFINLTRDFILGENPLPLPANRVVLEVLEDVIVDQSLVQGVQRLAEQGFRIALDDFVYHESWLPLIEIADIIKVEIPSLSRKQIREHVDTLARYPVKLLAEKVETEEEFETLRDMGFDLFQGYFLARPKILRGKRIPSSRLTILRLLAVLHNPESGIDVVERIIMQDATISYRLLRYINSAFFGLPRQVESIGQAIVFLGLDDIRRWTSLIALSGFSETPSELFHLAMIRARMCEKLAETSGRTDSNTFFTLGLFSALDALLGIPMAAILNELPLTDELRAALLIRAGIMGEALQCTLAYELTDWPHVSYQDLSARELNEIYIEALAWADESARQF